jgi:hypothetical protein
VSLALFTGSHASLSVVKGKLKTSLGHRAHVLKEV